jgi:hypothetical protein
MKFCGFTENVQARVLTERKVQFFSAPILQSISGRV